MKLYSLIGLLLLMGSCSQNPSKEATILTPSIPPIYTLKFSANISINNDTIFLNTIKYSGYLYQLQSNNRDTILVEGYVNGLQNGISKKWFANNKLMEQRFYFNGKKNGTQLAFWENGNKKFQFTAKDDAYEGEMKEWKVDGKLIHLANYKNGQEEGTQKLWYDNGKIRANYVIIKGERFGLLGTKNCRNVSDSVFSVK
jgi:antitoxin component YwqK of YwqJK toxin-antitoxin module